MERLRVCGSVAKKIQHHYPKLLSFTVKHGKTFLSDQIKKLETCENASPYDIYFWYLARLFNQRTGQKAYPSGGIKIYTNL